MPLQFQLHYGIDNQDHVGTPAPLVAAMHNEFGLKAEKQKKKKQNWEENRQACFFILLIKQLREEFSSTNTELSASVTMGSSHSQEDTDRVLTAMLQLASDISLDDSLLKYSGVNSAVVLEDSTSEFIQTSLDHVGGILTNFNGVPNAVGLGALVISMFLNIAVSSSGNDGGNTAEILSHVIAVEKAVAVRDTMNEYLNRLHMYMREPVKAQEETTRLEKQLSEQLTRLKNSMLFDGHMNPSSLKWWINGAAFHSQMVIHSARLETTDKIIGRAELENRVASIGSVVD
ncbi:uncharacterized protein LOC134335152 [Trichomycterus rosablanca]|uniref:uncharacterized protein LOC134335152 n=1 Tax=Trichomycterus rosablanca TaxID=2290929 RepID=UPI002F352B31